MANYRQIHVSIWKDEWFLDLDPEEKLLFVYLFSNESASLAGIYKIALKVIAFESGLDLSRVKSILGKFEKDGKVYYREGIVWVKNMRHYNRGSQKIDIRIQADLALVPDGELKRKYMAYYTPEADEQEPEPDEETEPEGDIDTPAGDEFTLDIPYQYPNDTDPYEMKGNESKSNEMKGKETIPPPPAPKPIDLMIGLWVQLFPEKPKPQATTKSYQKKVSARWKCQHFRENWQDALIRASRSPTLQAESWFNFEFFVRNDENYQKCLDGWMDWKDKQLLGGGARAATQAPDEPAGFAALRQYFGEKGLSVDGK